MIVHVFNSSMISGPETLVIPNLKSLNSESRIIFLLEQRRHADFNPITGYAKQHGIPSSAILVESRWDSKAMRGLAALLSNWSPKIVHAHDVKASLYALKARNILGKSKFKLISTHHGIAGRFGLKSKLYEKYYSYFVLPYFDQILTVCESDRLTLLRRGLPNHKISTHLNGIDRTPINSTSRPSLQAEIRASWGLFSDHTPPPLLFLGMVGRLAPEKQHKKALMTLQLMKQLDPNLNWTLLIFGTGPLEKSLKNLTLSLGLESHIKWMGYSDDIGSKMAGFDLILMFSSGEGIPIVLLEAGWSRTPVFSSNVGGIPDLLNSADVGITFDPTLPELLIAETLIHLLRSQQKLADLGDRLHHRVQENFSGRCWIEKLDQVYQNILAKEPS